MRGAALFVATLMLLSCGTTEPTRPPQSQPPSSSAAARQESASGGQSFEISGIARTIWDSLPPIEGIPSGDYDRDDWKHWVDEDGDCQDARAEILINYSTVEVTFADDRECRVVGGEWHDPYTGLVFTDASQLDIDHVVPLKVAWESGAWTWTAGKREQYANDLELSLLPVSASANRSKGAKAPNEWMPDNDAFQCEYVALWVSVKKKHGLGFTLEEARYVSGWLDGCGKGAEYAPPTSEPAPRSEPEPVRTSPACCKVCRTSKPCGDSCISRDKTCHKGPGCACSG